MERARAFFLIPTLFTLVFLTYFHEVTSITQDLGRHLLTGQLILETRSVPITNLYSYTNPDFPFINTHWLSEVVFFTFHRFFGFDGLLALTVAVALGAFSLVFFSCLRNDNLLSTTAVTLLFLPILFERTEIRPEIFSFLFLAIVVAVLYQNRKRPTRWIFALPLIELLWVNMHISFVLGIAVGGLFLIEAKATRRLAVVFLASCLATLINPNGIAGALYPFTVLQNYGYTIEENQNIIFLWQMLRKPTILWFAAGAAGLFTTLLLTLKRARLIDFMLTTLFILLASVFIRNFPLFVFATFIPFSHALGNLLVQLKLRFFAQYVVLLLLILLAIWEGKVLVSQRNIGFGLPQGAKEAVNFFEDNNLKGPIFNNFDIGSYLAYRLYPKERVFVDGRPEAYPKAFFQQVYIPMQNDSSRFRELEKQYRFNTIIFSHTDQTPWGTQFIRSITNDPSWNLVYLDDFIMVLVKKRVENKEIIRTFAMNKNSIHLSSFDQSKKHSLISMIVFFQKVGWQEQEITMHQKLLSLEPNSCPSLYRLATLHPQQDPFANPYLARLQRLCH